MLLVGDDWAKDHHDVEVQDVSGRRLAKALLPEGISGIANQHYRSFGVTIGGMTKTSGAMHVAKNTTKRVDKSGQPREYVSHLLRRTYGAGAKVRHVGSELTSVWWRIAAGRSGSKSWVPAPFRDR